MTTKNMNPILTGVISDEGLLIHQTIPINNSSFPFQQGDLLVWDGSAHIAKPATDDTSCLHQIGVALKASQENSNIDNVASVGLPNTTVGYGAISPRYTTAAETYNEGDAVYIGADAQTVTTSAGSNKIGVVKLLGGPAITGAAGVKVPVLIYSRDFVKFTN